MGIASAFRRAIGQDPETKAVSALSITDQKAARIWARFFGGGGDSWAGKAVTADTALQVATVWACVRLIAETIATLPLVLYGRDIQGNRSPLPDHPLSALLRVSPDGEHTAVEFWEGVGLSLCLNGNAYVEKVRLGDRLVSMRPLVFELVTVARDRNGMLAYRYADPKDSRILSEEDVWHIRGFGNGGDVGLSPISYARQTLGSSIAANEAAAKLFANGVRPSGVLQTDTVLTAPQRAMLKENIVAPLAGSTNAGGVFVLEGGLKFSAVSLSPKDSELLLTRRWDVEEICRWFGVPPVLVGHAAQGQTMWGTGIEQIMLGWLTLGLRSYLKRIEASILLQMIEPAERATVYAEFVVEGLLRADSAARAALYSAFGQNGIMTRNEMRAKENLAPLPGGDALTVQSNLIPIDKLGQVAPAPTSIEGGGRKRRAPFELKVFNEGDHPRDASGRFTAGAALVDLFKKAVGDGSHEEQVIFGTVKGARYSAAAGQNVEGWQFAANAQFLRHVQSKHGIGSGDRNPVRPDDLQHLPVIAHEGTVTRGGKTKRQALQTVISSHTINGVKYRAAWAVRQRKKRLTLQTFYRG